MVCFCVGGCTWTWADPPPTDHELGKLLDALEGEYTVVMFSDPNEFQVYEPEFIESVHKNHLDLRRAVEQPVLAGARRASNTTRDTRPLFEKYQFFTPGKPRASYLRRHHLLI